MIKLALDTCVLFPLSKVLTKIKDSQKGTDRIMLELRGEEKAAYYQLGELTRQFPGYKWDKTKTIKSNIISCGNMIERKRSLLFKDIGDCLFRYMGINEEKITKNAQTCSKKFLKQVEVIDDIIKYAALQAVDIDTKAFTIADILLDESSTSYRASLLREIEKSKGFDINERIFQSRERLNGNLKEKIRAELCGFIKKYLARREIEDEFINKYTAQRDLTQQVAACELLRLKEKGEVEFYVLSETFRELNNHVEVPGIQPKKGFLTITEDERDIIFDHAQLVTFEEGLNPVIAALSKAYRTARSERNHPMQNDVNSLGEFGDSIIMAQAAVSGLILVTFNGKDFIFYDVRNNCAIREHIKEVNTAEPYRMVASKAIPCFPSEIFSWMSNRIDLSEKNELAEDIIVEEKEDNTNTMVAKLKPGVSAKYDVGNDVLTIEENE